MIYVHCWRIPASYGWHSLNMEWNGVKWNGIIWDGRGQNLLPQTERVPPQALEANYSQWNVY